MNSRSGWVKGTECGCVSRAGHWKYADLRMAYDQLLKDAVLAYPIENFGRFNHDSKLTILAIALALYDAKITYAKDKKLDIPSSPLAEAAIHFGLTGKLLYLGFAKNIKIESLKYALNMLKTEIHSTIILVNADSKAATSYILQR